MRPVPALNDAVSLLSLLRRLERQAHKLPHIDCEGVAGGLVVPSPLDPGASVVYLVASGVPTARGGAERRWWAENREAIERALDQRRVSDVTVIFPGEWPARVSRHGTSKNVRVRLVSSVYHLWVDRLKRHNADGELDEAARARLLTTLAPPISVQDERRYTPPSLDLVYETQRASEARSALLEEPANPVAGLTVLFGPGGIGKSFFLRRLAARLGRQAQTEATVGIPVYAELPLLLHTNALETWLSERGLRLPLDDIRVLLEEGIVVPVLDALDELVRGQAREGSRQFLGRVAETFGSSATGILSSRDYYLHLDPLVPTELGEQPAYLTVGFFSRTGRRRYVQMRTALREEHASRWANQLEVQATEALSGAGEAEIESLVGHPLFLDAFCQMIVEIPEDRRAAEVESFQLRSPDIFGEIVDRVLRREHEDKFLPGWKMQGLASQLSGQWKDPFQPVLQRQVLRALVLAAAKDGGAEALRRGIEDARYRRLRHGLFTFSQSAGGGSPTDELARVIRETMGDPCVEPTVPQNEAEGVCSQALQELVGAYRSHTLADTQSGQPETLVFATRHRAYFDYLLAEAILDELMRALRPGEEGLDEDFVLWCLSHNIIERGDEDAPPFASCLDFVLWHREAVERASAEAERYLSQVDNSAEELTSYIVSFGVALLLRNAQRSGNATVAGLEVAGDRAVAIRLLPDIVPNITDFAVESCRFPSLALRDLDLRNVTFLDVELSSLQIGDCTWQDVTLDVTADSIKLYGRVEFEGCQFSVSGPASEGFEVQWGPGTKISFRNCSFSGQMLTKLEDLSRASATVAIDDCSELRPEVRGRFSPGRQFVNRLITLARKHGHNEYGVFWAKLRGLSPATAHSFSDALQVLVKHDIIQSASAQMIKLTKRAEEARYSPRGAMGTRPYDDVADFWNPVVAELDGILTEGR